MSIAMDLQVHAAEGVRSDELDIVPDPGYACASTIVPTPGHAFDLDYTTGRFNYKICGRCGVVRISERHT
jgi:hypothetical protein